MIRQHYICHAALMAVRPGDISCGAVALASAMIITSVRSGEAEKESVWEDRKESWEKPLPNPLTRVFGA